MTTLPQEGGCLCGDVRYRIDEDPVTVYVCHCTDCQRQTGSSFALTMIVRADSIEVTRGQPEEYALEMEDGRVKRSRFCARCSTRLFGPSSVAGLVVVEPGTLDDTSWVRPVGHIWTRSAQAWVVIPEGTLRFEKQASQQESLAFARAWKAQSSSG